MFTLASFHLLSLPRSNCQALWLTYLRDFINLNPKKLLIMHGIDGNCVKHHVHNFSITPITTNHTPPLSLCLPTNQQTPTNSQSYLSTQSTDSTYQFHAIDSTISTHFYLLIIFNLQATDIRWLCPLRIHSCRLAIIKIDRGKDETYHQMWSRLLPYNTPIILILLHGFVWHSMLYLHDSLLNLVCLIPNTQDRESPVLKTFFSFRAKSFLLVLCLHRRPRWTSG
jgi:hypothetical protein